MFCHNKDYRLNLGSIIGILGEGKSMQLQSVTTVKRYRAVVETVSFSDTVCFALMYCYVT